MRNGLKIFFGNSNPTLAAAICQHLEVAPGKMTIHMFSNENMKVKIEENVRNDDVFVIQTSASPVNQNLMELLIIIDALRYASAGRITAVTPYYFYARSDKKDEPRISITARLVADLLQASGAGRILTMQLHSPQIMGFTHIPVDQLLATNVLLEYFQNKNLTNAVVAAPDVGSAKDSRVFSRGLGLPLIIMDKERQGDQEKVAVHNIIGDAEGKDVLIADDEILTGGSILKAAEVLKQNGARRIYACCTHAFFSREAVKRFDDSIIEEVVMTDTLPITQFNLSNKFKVLSVANLFANAIKAIHYGDSVGALFTEFVKS